jgi:hypothetical protein
VLYPFSAGSANLHSLPAMRLLHGSVKDTPYGALCVAVRCFFEELVEEKVIVERRPFAEGYLIKSLIGASHARNKLVFQGGQINEPSPPITPHHTGALEYRGAREQGSECP